jgi:hypothetical protein
MPEAPPPTGYLDIPPGFDFPAEKKQIELYRTESNVSAQRAHAWNILAGLTRPAPDGVHALFETWLLEEETFDPATTSLAARPALPRFKPPGQSVRVQTPIPKTLTNEALTFVLFNDAAYRHIRTNRLYQRAKLDELAKDGALDAKIPENRTIPPFPRDSVVVKTVWWPVAKNAVSAMPIWDAETNPPRPTGNGPPTWPRYVGIDPTHRSPGADKTRDIVFDGKIERRSHIVGLNRFHYITIDQPDTVAIVNGNKELSKLAQASFGRPLAVGDYAVLVGLHVTTKEIDDWVWATYWWHDRPDMGPYAADRIGSLTGVWRNFLMSASYDLNLPREKDGGPHTSFNPWLEGRFADGGHGGGVVSNCMNCHNRASTGVRSFLPIYRGDPDLTGDSAFAAGSVRTDFLWSIIRYAK